MNGVIILDKPPGISSHGAVQRARRITGIKKIGHLGTLDPIGTGVLPLVVGRATRLARFFSDHERVYEATILFGFATESYDSDGAPLGDAVDVTLDRERLEAMMAESTGKISQAPPPVSAKKIDGVPAYKLARQNKPVELAPVEIEIFELELLEVEKTRARVRLRCSRGTYVRSLAHELGQKWGCGAHVVELRRISAGDFHIDRAHTLESLEALAKEERLSEAYLTGEQLLPEIPAQRVDAITAARIAHGRDFQVSPFANPGNARRIKAIGPNGLLLAIAEARMPQLYHPIVVLQQAS